MPQHKQSTSLGNIQGSVIHGYMRLVTLDCNYSETCSQAPRQTKIRTEQVTKYFT